MDYVYVVYYSESNYEPQSNICAFQYEKDAIKYIENENGLNPKVGQFLNYEMVKFE